MLKRLGKTSLTAVCLAAFFLCCAAFFGPEARAEEDLTAYRVREEKVTGLIDGIIRFRDQTEETMRALGLLPAPWPSVVDRVHDPEGSAGFRFRKGAELLEIWFPNIRDADEAIVTYQGDVWLIDCGDRRWGLRGVRLMQLLGIDHVDRLFNSHPHHDHLNGLQVTDDNMKVGELLICFPSTATEHSVFAMRSCEVRGIRVKEYGDGDTFAMGDGRVTLTVCQNSDPALDMNNRSALTMIRYGDRSIFFTGDMEQPGQQSLMERTDPAWLKCDILKYPHHGKSPLNEAFYRALSPLLTVVTSQENRPDAGQLWIREKGLPAVYTNKTDTYVHLATEGHVWLCEYVTAAELKKRGR